MTLPLLEVPAQLSKGPWRHWASKLVANNTFEPRFHLGKVAFLKTVAPIVVGVGYPTDDQQEMARRRAIDLTPSVSKGPNFVGGSGGGDAFLLGQGIELITVGALTL